MYVPIFEYVTKLKEVFELYEKIKKSFEGLRDKRIAIQQTDICSLAEKYFGFEEWQKGKIKLEGKLSAYTLNINYPVYTPAHLKAIRQSVPEFPKIPRNIQDKISLEVQVSALTVPAIAYPPIQLADGSKAKILWLYHHESHGLVYEAKQGGLVKENVCSIFGIGPQDKPIPILADPSFPVQNLYKHVVIEGSVLTAPIDLFEQFSSKTNRFILDYFSYCYRPFSGSEGVLAIDIRASKGKATIVDGKSIPFRILYTVQGLIGLPETVVGDRNDSIIAECLDAIPDRQGLAPVRTIGDQHNDAHAIVSMGETFWQKGKSGAAIAAFIPVDATDAGYGQAALAQLSNNWQLWQKMARKKIRERFSIEPQIRPLICTNKVHEKLFHPNGLQIPASVESKLQSTNPDIRRSIDWLGISVGKEGSL